MHQLEVALEAEYQEGKARFQRGNAFYRPGSQLARDLGVLTAAVYKAQTDHLHVLDAMTAAGVRSLRYLLEANADFVWANDGNPDLQPTLRGNFSQVDAQRVHLSFMSAQQLLYQCRSDRHYFDLIDVDAFGNPLSFVAGCLGTVRFGGLLYLTSTDGRSLSGHCPAQSLQQWGAFARSHPAIQEQALRIGLGAVAQQAAFQGYGIEPVFSLFHRQTYRLMVRVLAQPNWQIEHYGWLGYCHRCGNFQSPDWRSLGRAVCSCGPEAFPLSLSGPLWLGPLHDRTYLQSMERLAQQWGWQQRAQLLHLMQAEAEMPPYFYTLGEIGRRGQMDISKRSRLQQGLLARGYRFSLTHIHPEGIKTDAPFSMCLEVARSE
jgi:tRNA (guanine26-N2/guanine27-N2)-dimethyltransferase